MFALSLIIVKERMMDISTLISSSRHIQLSAEESKIPWDEPAFSQRMLANHL